MVSREDSERTEKLDKWREIKENTSKIIVDNRSKLDEIKSKDPKTTPEIQKELQEIQVRHFTLMRLGQQRFIVFL